MLDRLRSFWQLPDLGDEEKNNAAFLLRAVLAIALTGAGLFAVASAFAWQETSPLVLAIVITLILAVVGLFVLLRRGHVRTTSLILLALLWLAFTLPALRYGGLHDTSLAGYFVVLLIAAATGGAGSLVFCLALVLVSTLAMFVAEHLAIIVPYVAIPTQVNDLALLLIALSLSAFIHIYVTRTTTGLYRRARDAARTLSETNQELLTSRDTLVRQQAVLERRARYLEATALVAREATATVDDLQSLFSHLVHVISDELDFYHTGLFMIDPTGEWAELQAASSLGGQVMLARGHRLRVGQEGVVGHAAGKGQAKIALDVDAEGTFFRNPDLPGTRSEVALPLQVRNRTVGVLDVQSQEAGAFSDEDLTVLQGLADQVALALDKASLFEQLQQMVAARQSAFRDASRAAWRELFYAQGSLGFVSEEQGTALAGDQLEPHMAAALRTGQVTRAEHSADPSLGPSVAIPIRVRGQVVGVVDGRKVGGEWSGDEIDLLAALTEQLNLALEGARLYGEAQRRAVRDQFLSQVTARMRETFDMRVVLETVADELYQRLDLDRVAIRLSLPETAVTPE